MNTPLELQSYILKYWRATSGRVISGCAIRSYNILNTYDLKIFHQLQYIFVTQGSRFMNSVYFTKLRCLKNSKVSYHKLFGTDITQGNKSAILNIPINQLKHN